MRRFPLRRFVAASLAFLLIASAPGTGAYDAAAQTVGKGTAGAGSSVSAVPVLGLSGFTAPVPLTSPSALTLSPSLLSAPVATPEIVAAPVAALSAGVHAAAVEAEAVAIGPAKIVATPAALETSPKTGPPVKFAPAPLANTLSAASLPDRPAGADELFDGAKAKTAVAQPKSSVFAGLSRGVRKGLVILTLGLGLLGAGGVQAQSVPPKNPPHVTQAAPKDTLNRKHGTAQQKAAELARLQAQIAAAKTDTTGAQTVQQPVAQDTVVQAPLPRPLVAEASVDRQGVTVGERIHLTITLRNTSDKPVTLQNLRGSVQEALPADLEIEDKNAEVPLVLAPGESKTVVYEVIPFGSGTLTLDGGVAVVSVGEKAVYPEGIEIVMPKTEITVKTVLTPDWKQKGLRDIVGVKRGEGPNWMWLAAIPLGLLMFFGVYRLVAARRLYPKLDATRLSLVTLTQENLARLEADSAGLDAPSFYARYQELLTGFMVDFAGMPKKARDARAFGRDLHKSFYDAGQVDVAARLAVEAEAARFVGGEKDPTERARMIGRLKALIDGVAGMAGKPKAANTSALGMLALLPGAAGLTFGSPWVLLLLIPFFTYVLWSWRARAKAKTERFSVSSSAQTPKRRTLRERLAGLPRVLRLAALGLMIVALARPMIGTKRTETFIPSTDTMVSIDLSGSMSGAKLEGVRDAVRVYVEEQRRGTENRVGMVTFSDNSYLDVKLTTDYDALISHLKELETSGSTAIGKSMLTAIAHFLELNALDLDGKVDPRAAEVQRLLRDQGLSAALAYAKAYPDLMKSILQPERAKIVVIFTDGDSNTGIKPEDAADIAASLGVKVYGVGIAGQYESFNETTLRTVAEKTGAKFYRAGDAAAMREVLLEISRIEKSPAKIVSSVAVKDYTSLIALLALLLLGAELALANTRLRTLYGLAFVLALNQAPMMTPGQWTPSLPATTMTAQVSAGVTSAVPDEVVEGNKLYNQGRFTEALKKYGEALERHPDVPEIYFNMADAYLRLGQYEKADAAWQKYLTLTKDAKRQSQVLFNLGNSALMAGDAEKAVELYKEALRRDSGNQDAKWNLEALKQAQKEQQQKEGKPGKDSKKGQQGKQKGKPGDGKPGDGKPGDGKPGDGKPGDGKPGDGKPGDKPGEPKAGDKKDGADKLGQALGDQEKGEKDAARKGMTRKGSGVWGMAALPLAFAGHGLVFSSAAFLWVVGIGLPLAAVLIAWGIKKRLDAAKTLSPGTAPKTFRSWWGARRFLGKSALALAALGLIGLAAGDPRGGMVDERVNFGGKDIVVAVDASYSMTYAEDGRMERTQKELNEFITRLQGTDRVGLVVFAGKSRTASPISIDYGNFEFKINRLDVEARGLKEGSDLAAAIKYSANHFETAKKLGDRQRILIVISDGDVPEGEIAAAIAAAEAHGVTVYAIGVGDPSGTKIKVPNVDGTGSEYLLDSKTGGPAVTRLNEAPLRELAERTGGAYFRAGSRASIDNILNEVSRLEQGQKGDTIKSPRPVGVYLLWPAFLMLLLDLLLPGRSLLRRDAPKPGVEGGKADDKTKGPGGAGLLGAALIPLGAWPQILPFVALATAVAAYLAADSWSGGKITRSIREAWQTRRRVVEKGVASDLIHLYDLREIDERRLSSFVRAWQEAKEPLRETLIASASHDEALWREKLTAAYLSGAKPETLEKILSALRRTGRARLEALKPVTDRIALRRADISWMDHSAVQERLEALAAAAADKPAAFVEPAAPAPRKYGPLSRLKRGATIAVLSLLILVTGVSSIGTMQFRAEQRAAAEMSTKLFYAEDLFIFSDRYVDSRIPEEVLPALKRWTESPKTAGPDFERALIILRESPDPKADNILIAVFRRAGVLPLTNKAESIMLLSLIERDNDAVWQSMDQLITNSRTDAASARFLVKLTVLGVQSGNPKALAQVFRVLKSPNKEVQQAAAGVLYAHLSRDEGARFFEELSAVQAKHAGDPMLQLWTASFAFRRLAEPTVADADLAKAKVFLDQALANAQRIDGYRAMVYAQTPPDQEVQAPPSMVTLLVDIADRMQGDGGAPAPVAAASRYLVSKAATVLIKDAEKAIPGLHERLIADGVVLPDTQGGGYYDEYEGGWGGYYGRGGGGTQQNYREVYKLAHLRTLQADIDSLGAPLAAPPTKENAAVRELLDRAKPTTDVMLETGVKAGMMEGGTAAESVAEQLYPVLREGESVFAGHSFLRAAGFAPSLADYSSRLAYPETIDEAGLAKLRGFLAAAAASGQGWDSGGKPRALTWAEKLYLAGALDAVDSVRAKNFPGAAAPAATEGESLFLAKLSLALSARAKDSAFALQTEKDLIAHAAKAPLDSVDAAQVLTQVFASVKGTAHEAAAVDALSVALKGPSAALFAPGALARSEEALRKSAEQAEAAFPGLKARLFLAGLRENEYSWRTGFRQRHYRVLREEVAALAAADKKALTPAQSAAVAAVKNTARYEALAALAGAPAGDSVGEIAADETNVLLLAGYRVFPGSEFDVALRAAGLMPAGTGTGLSDYKQSYTRAELQATRDWVASIAASGVTLGSPSRALSWNEKAYLAVAIDRLDEILVKRFGAPPVAAPRTLLETVRRPGQESLALVRLVIELRSHPGDAAFAVRAQETMLVLLKARPADVSDAASALGFVRKAVSGTAYEEAELTALIAALQTPTGKLLQEAAASEAEYAAKQIGELSEKAFPSLNKALRLSGARVDEDEWREFKLHHYRDLREEIAFASAAVKTPAPEQSAAAARAARVLPLLEKIAALSGKPAGDSAGEIAAERVNSSLQNGYSVFPGSVFNDQLRSIGVMDPAAGNSESDHRESYTRAQLVVLRGWLKGVLASRQGWDSDGTTRRALTPEEKTALDEALAATDRALAAFDAPAKKFHAFSPLALGALPVVGFAPWWLLFAVIALASAYAVWKLLAQPQAVAVEEPGRDGVPASVLARHRRVELVARRMATAVNGGSFRSRFIGSGGTDFAEARPYQNEDIRDIDWKTSAKKDELYSKKFELERDMPLMLVVDISGSGRFGTRGTDKRTALEDVAAVLALAAAHSNIRVGAVLVSDRVELVIPPRGGTRHAMTIVDAILKAQAQGKTTDLKPGLEAAGQFLRSRGMVAVISDFISADFKDALGALASRHDVRPIRVTDPAEMSPLPDVGLLPVVDAETGATRMLDTSSDDVRKESASAIARREASVESAFTSARVDPISVSTEGDPLEYLEQAFHPKAKQPFKP